MNTDYFTIKRTCGNCDSYEDGNCSIRFVILKDGKRVPMVRKKNQKGCPVFMQRI